MSYFNYRHPAFAYPRADWFKPEKEKEIDEVKCANLCEALNEIGIVAELCIEICEFAYGKSSLPLRVKRSWCKPKVKIVAPKVEHATCHDEEFWVDASGGSSQSVFFDKIAKKRKRDQEVQRAMWNNGLGDIRHMLELPVDWHELLTIPDVGHDLDMTMF